MAGNKLCFIMAFQVIVIHAITVRSVNLTSHSGTRLFNTLFEDYKPHVRPVLHESGQIKVDIMVHLQKLHGINVLQQSMKTTLYVYFSWFDELLTWDPNDFNGTARMIFPYGHNIWTPDLEIANSLDNPSDLWFQNSNVLLNFRGQIIIWSLIQLESSCEIKTKKFPLDTQICTILLMTSASLEKMILLNSIMDHIILQDVSTFAEWEILENTVETVTYFLTCDMFLCHGNESEHDLTYKGIHYTLKLQRKCMSCVMNIIVPVILLAGLNLLTFFVPCESGEKTVFPISVFLTLAIFLTVITSSLPESVDGISYISMYVTFQLTVGVLTLLATVVSLNIFNHSERGKIPRIAITLVKIFFNRNGPECLKPTTVETDNDVPAVRTEDQYNADTMETVTKCPIITWSDVSKAFDRLMFSVLAFCEFVVLVTFLTLLLT